jgi:hypothetical protein
MIGKLATERTYAECYKPRRRGDEPDEPTRIAQKSCAWHNRGAIR